MWCRILSYAVSASGNYVATLSRVDNFDYVDLWKINASSNQDLSTWTTKKVSTGRLVGVSDPSE